MTFIRVRNPDTGVESDVPEANYWLRRGQLVAVDKPHMPPAERARRPKKRAPHKGVELAGPAEVSAETNESEEG